MRNHTIDLLKGLAAISVIAGHAVQRGIVVGYNDHIIYRFIYTYHMPLFMLLSGYVFFLSTKEYNWKLIWKKWKRLVIPTFVWSYLLFFLKDFTFTGLLPFVKFPNRLDTYTQLLVKRPEFLIWFLYIVFINIVVITLGKMYFKKIFLLYLFIIYFMIFQSNTMNFGIHRLKVYMPIFIVGYYAAQYTTLKNKIEPLYKYIIPSALLGFLVLFPYWNLYNPNLYIQWGLALCSMVVIVYCIKFVSVGSMTDRCFAYCGKYSLELYLCQCVCLNIGIGSGYLRIFSIFIIATWLSIVFARWTTKYHLINSILYGRF